MANIKKLTLDRILHTQGFGTRKACRELIRSGCVAVEGEVVEDCELSWHTEGLKFSVDGEAWLFREHLYLALNKPPDFECSRKPSHHPGVLTLFPPQFDLRNVQPVGRLDHDTTGLLLLSDDGSFIHAQSSPKRHVPKLYLARTHAPVTDALIGQLLGGVQLNDEPAPLAAVSCVRVGEHAIEIVLEQGKYHQVKRMLAAAGNNCEALTRTAIGGLTLESLALEPGEWCYLDTKQLGQLKPSVDR